MIDQGRSWTASTLTWNRSPSTPEEAVEIEKAEQYQKAARPRICIALLLFLITIMMIALILSASAVGGGRKGW